MAASPAAYPVRGACHVGASIPTSRRPVGTAVTLFTSLCSLQQAAGLQQAACHAAPSSTIAGPPPLQPALPASPPRRQRARISPGTASGSNSLGFLRALDADQLRAATCTASDAIRVKAGPGSGKTRVMISRIGWLIQQQRVAPTSIMAITFTNKAASELRVRQ